MEIIFPVWVEVDFSIIHPRSLLKSTPFQEPLNFVQFIAKNSPKSGKIIVERDEGGRGLGHRDEGVIRGVVKMAKFTVTYFMDDPYSLFSSVSVCVSVSVSVCSLLILPL